MATRKKPATKVEPPEDSGSHLISQAILSLVGQVPSSKERKSQTPADDARKKANAAAAKAAKMRSKTPMRRQRTKRL